MKTSFLFLLSLCFGGMLLAQGPQDAFRYSFGSPLGTARFAGTGGSISALGVDYTTIHTNPAGIGANRYSKFQVSPGFSLTSTEGRLTNGNGNPSVSDAVVAVTLPSLGLIWAGGENSRSNINFGIGLTRLADFNETITTRGSSEGSIIDAIVEDINDDIFDPFRAELIFDIQDALLEDDLGFFSAFDFTENAGLEITRNGLTERSGSMNEFALALAGSSRTDRFQWGVSLGVPFFSYNEVSTYDEVDEGDQLLEFDDSGFDTNLESSGNGVNFKLGFMARPTDGLRVSGAVHSPTFWNIEETFSTTLEYNFTDADNVAFGGVARSDQSESVVNLRTPWKFMVGLGYILGKSGFIGIDVDYQNFDQNEVSFDDFATADEPTNQDIDLLFKGSIGARLGGEINVKPVQIRAGVEYRQLPFDGTRFLPVENPDNVIDDETILTYSGGLGYAKGKFFVDLAVQYAAYETIYRPYSVFLITPQNVETSRTRIGTVLTFGYRGF